MAEIRYVHAADLHLDATFAGLTRENASDGLNKLLQDATFTALERLVRLCEAQRPHFLVLAGDIYNREDASIRAQLKLRDACKRLDALSIPVYIAHGNHDPLSSRFQSLKFPPNVHVFSAEAPEILEFIGQDNERALIQGMSHGQDREARNLSLMFQRQSDEQAFQLGVLHCSVENSGQADRYAPCTLSDLKKAGLDAWALGHVHTRAVLCEEPFIAYPGNIQGLHINETGSRGCLLVRARDIGGIWRCESEFHSLGPVQWRKLQLDMDQVTEQSELESRLDKLAAEEREEAEPGVAAIINRISISGRTPLNAWLRQDGRLEDMQEIIARNSDNRTLIALKDVELDTRDEKSWEESMAREDLLGETMRVYSELEKNPEQFKEVLDHALAPIQKRHQLMSFIQESAEPELLDLLYQAENLCMDILENH